MVNRSNGIVSIHKRSCPDCSGVINVTNNQAKCIKCQTKIRDVQDYHLRYGNMRRRILGHNC